MACGPERARLRCVDPGRGQRRRSRAAWRAPSVPSRSLERGATGRGRGAAGSQERLAEREPGARAADRRVERPRRSRRASVAGRRPRNASVRCSASGATERAASGSAAASPERDQRVTGRLRQFQRDERAVRSSGCGARAGARHAASAAPPARSSRRSRCIATVVVRSRTSARPPGRSNLRVDRAPGRSATQTQTLPDRLLRRPAAGAGDAGDPDADVGAEARAARRRPARRRPPARPLRRADQLRGHARERGLRLVGVDDDAAQHVRRGARRGRSAGPPAARPCTTRPGDDRQPAGRAAARRPARRPSTRRRRTAVAVALGTTSLERIVGACGRGSYTVAISSSPRRRHVVISRRSSRAAARLAQRLGDLGLRHPDQPQDPLLELARAGEQRSQRAPSATRRRPHRLQLARRPRQDQRPAGRASPSGTTRPGAVPTGSSTTAPSGTCACLRVAAPHRLLARRRASAPRIRATIARDPLLHASSSTSGRPANRRRPRR